MNGLEGLKNQGESQISNELLTSIVAPEESLEDSVIDQKREIGAEEDAKVDIDSREEEELRLSQAFHQPLPRVVVVNVVF